MQKKLQVVVWSSRCNFIQNMTKKLQVVVWSSHCNFSLKCTWFFVKNIYVVKIQVSPEMIKSELVIFATYMFFANKITTTGSSAFQKKYNDWIRPPLVIFLSIFEKFISPDSNGQGQHYWFLDNASFLKHKIQS